MKTESISSIVNTLQPLALMSVGGLATSTTSTGQQCTTVPLTRFSQESAATIAMPKKTDVGSSSAAISLTSTPWAVRVPATWTGSTSTSITTHPLTCTSPEPTAITRIGLSEFCVKKPFHSSRSCYTCIYTCTRLMSWYKMVFLALFIMVSVLHLLFRKLNVSVERLKNHCTCNESLKP